MNRIADSNLLYLVRMAAANTLLCIHRDPAQLGLLQEHGYELATAVNGSDGLRLFMSRPVDAVVLEYYLGLMDGVAVADEIKHVRPELPIVMLVDHLDLPADTLKSIDALVVKSDGIHFLLATVHFVLKVKPFQSHATAAVPARPSKTVPSLTDLVAVNHDASFSPKVWRDIRSGTLQF